MMSPVPATTGQLRTRVQDMEIGDYIKFEYNDQPQSMTVLKLGNNVTATNEGSLTGNPYGYNKIFYGYLIKVQKGMLVSDRVTSNTVSWDLLNSLQVIQGRPIDAGNIIPTMTSNTSPSGVASASSVYNGREPYNAFNKSVGDYSKQWTTTREANGVGWIAYEFVNPVVLRGYSISVTYISEAPKNWTFEGWDGSKWIELDKQENITTWVSDTKKIFYINDSNVPYSKYRINVIASNSSSYVSINEIEMMETAGIIRSLTGGVAYTDTQGNKSLTDQGLGGWPVINEWDLYVAGFPTDKIQTGKTLDDVFHWTPLSTWVQDTPIISLYGSNYRVSRGNNTSSSGVKNFTPNRTSADSNIYVGFRPVFQYYE